MAPSWRGGRSLCERTHENRPRDSEKDKRNSQIRNVHAHISSIKSQKRLSFSRPTTRPRTILLFQDRFNTQIKTCNKKTNCLVIFERNGSPKNKINCWNAPTHRSFKIYICFFIRTDLEKCGIHHMLINESSTVNGCRQNESPNSC